MNAGRSGQMRPLLRVCTCVLMSAAVSRMYTMSFLKRIEGLNCLSSSAERHGQVNPLPDRMAVQHSSVYCALRAGMKKKTSGRSFCFEKHSKHRLPLEYDDRPRSSRS